MATRNQQQQPLFDASAENSENAPLYTSSRLAAQKGAAGAAVKPDRSTTTSTGLARPIPTRGNATSTTATTTAAPAVRRSTRTASAAAGAKSSSGSASSGLPAPSATAALSSSGVGVKRTATRVPKRMTEEEAVLAAGHLSKHDRASTTTATTGRSAAAAATTTNTHRPTLVRPSSSAGTASTTRAASQQQQAEDDDEEDENAGGAGAPAAKTRRIDAAANRAAVSSRRAREAAEAAKAQAEAVMLRQQQQQREELEMQKLQQQQQQALDAQYYDAEGDATADGSLVPENARAKRLRLLEEIQDESDALLLVVTNEDGDKSYAVDIDQDDIDDPAMCAEYAAEIMDYLMDRETHFAPDPQYIVRHGEIKWGMRAILVDWIVEVHGKFKFLPETLFLATNIMDRFLTRRVCSLDKFQLVGLVALFVAAKTEEVFCPAADQFVFMADNAFTKDDLLGAEQYLLRVLEFDLWAPGPLSFIRRISKMDDYSAPHRNAAKYFAEMTLLDHRFLEYPMSQVAAASMYLARNIHKCEEWSPMLVQASGYTENEILPVVSLLIDWMSKHRGTDDNGEGAFFIKKYGAKKATKFVRAALIWVANRKGMAEYIQWVVDEAAARDAAAEDAGRVAADPAAVDDHRGRSFEPASPPRGSTTAPVAATTRARGTAAGGKRGNGASQEPAAF